MSSVPKTSAILSRRAQVSEQLLSSYLGDARARRISRRYFPSRDGIVEILELLLNLMYPGYFGRRDLDTALRH